MIIFFILFLVINIVGLYGVLKGYLTILLVYLPNEKLEGGIIGYTPLDPLGTLFGSLLKMVRC